MHLAVGCAPEKGKEVTGVDPYFFAMALRLVTEWHSLLLINKRGNSADDFVTLL